jgi:SPX domain protein involved in polyphosphate accumulation
MSEDYRYELKFVLDEVSAVEAFRWLHCHTTARTAYPDRMVNSLYCDDLNFSSVADNLAGVSDRKKVRLRWYQDTNGLETGLPVMELKLRNGRLGRKVSYTLPDVQDWLARLRIQDVMAQVNRALAAQDFIFDDYMQPTLHVKYARSYFEDLEGLRITMDSDIEFYGTLPHQVLGETPALRYPNKIMEIKFPPAMKNRVSRLIKPLCMVPKRHSKYLVGLAIMQQVVYI